MKASHASRLAGVFLMACRYVRAFAAKPRFIYVGAASRKGWSFDRLAQAADCHKCYRFFDLTLRLSCLVTLHGEHINCAEDVPVKTVRRTRRNIRQPSDGP